MLIRSVDYSAIGEELSARKPQKLYVLFQCPRVGSFPGCTFLSPFLKASKYLPWTNLYQCTSRVCSLWQVHLQTLHPLWFLAFILEIAVLWGLALCPFQTWQIINLWEVIKTKRIKTTQLCELQEWISSLSKNVLALLLLNFTHQSFLSLRNN